ncbi:hypothetical protein CCR75_005006 [Bremia lactucae]|uniref:Uncharacterized protein n=1 Tax=Bremia lactucae TaxID=4779 RepID=A0A976FQK0_BRELC|nr:hypothetical protein CCR75_005006 [Bremia lactucae]
MVCFIGKRHIALRRLSYGGSAPHAGGQDKSSISSLLKITGFVGGLAYIYNDPDVLPASIKKLLSIQDLEGRAMSPEEYEKWRAKQAGFLTFVTQQNEKEIKPIFAQKKENYEPPNTNDDVPIPRGDVSPLEVKSSLEKLLAEARENEAAFIADFKLNRNSLSEEDSQMLQAFKDEKSRLKKQLEFFNNTK